MLYVPTEHLRPGMVLSRDIWSYGSTFQTVPLLATGQVLTHQNIVRINAFGIAGAYIVNRATDYVQIQEVIDESTRNSALRDIKTAFDEFASASSMLHTDRVESLTAIARQLVMDILKNSDALVNLVDLKSYDDYTYRHCLSVSILTVLTGISMGMRNDDLDKLALSSMLHDIGKTCIPLSIINKPDKLTAQEMEVIKQHPLMATKLLPRMRQLTPKVVMGIEQHHERYDGTGYPYGLAGNKISKFGRLLAVADVYDALTSKRPYRRAMLPSEGIEYIMGNVDTHFDNDVVVAFLENVVAYPVGICVKLSNGKYAVVVKNRRGSVLRPVVRLLAPEDGNYIDLDLYADPKCWNITIVGTGYGDDNSEFGNAVNPENNDMMKR